MMPTMVLTLVGIGVALPVCQMCVWIGDGVAQSVEFAAIGEPLLYTALFTLVGASVTLAAALIPAWVAARDSGTRAEAMMENSTYLTSSVPGILLAFGVLHLLLGLRRYVPVDWGGESVWLWLEGAGVVLVVA